MLVSLFFNILFRKAQPEKVVLGRWGYHWEKNKHIQKYYE